MKKIAIVSGKGGVGKTVLASSLAVLFAKEKKVIACDFDVDASNLALALGMEERNFNWHEIEASEKAQLIESKCNACKACMRACTFGAITWNKEKNKPAINHLLCEGCGACSIVCKQNAIEIVRVKNAYIGFAKYENGFCVISGQLKMGASGSGKVVEALKELAYELASREKPELMLFDSAAGISCATIASLRDADFAIGITEPTKASLRDLKRALKVASFFKIPYGVVINKFDLNPELSRRIEKMFRGKVLGKIPYDKKVIEAIVQMKPVVSYKCEASEAIRKIKNALAEILNS